jgi:1-acyl-sn-glycerol-3-phosphate acyltransferase
MSENEKFIDIEKAIASKNPRLLKWLPKFVLRYIKRKLHEDQLNSAIEENKHLFGVDFADAAVKEVGATVKVQGLENVPPKGGVILAANHPLGGLDGVAFITAVGQVRQDIKFFVNDLLMAMKNFAPIFVPVNKHGKNTVDYYKKFEDVYASDECLLIFPAGLVSRKHDRKTIMDLQWKKSFISKSIQYQRDIVPVYIEGKNSKKFYNIAYWRKKLGLKANIEMFYLVDEMYKQKGKNITFVFGEPIPWQTFNDGQPHEIWADKVKQHVYSLHSGDESKRIKVGEVQSTMS